MYYGLGVLTLEYQVQVCVSTKVLKTDVRESDE